MRTNKPSVLLLVALVGCAKANTGSPGSDANGHGGPDGPSADASCGDQCDHDHDGVVDGSDECMNTPANETVNSKGCADSQLTATLQPFPPFGLTWTPTGDIGTNGGLVWNYTGIERGDLFHIVWVICDDPATPCGMSLDGPIDAAAEHWTYSAADSNLANGKVVFTNTTHILLADNSKPQLTGRLTMTVVDSAGGLVFADTTTLNVPPRQGAYGVEIFKNNFTITAIEEVQDPSNQQWKPYVEYYNAAPTPTAGGGAVTSFGGSFYAK